MGRGQVVEKPVNPIMDGGRPLHSARVVGGVGEAVWAGAVCWWERAGQRNTGVRSRHDNMKYRGSTPSVQHSPALYCSR